MPRSDEYRGPERRERDEREIEIDKRMSDLNERLRHVEELLVNDNDPDAGIVAVVRKIKHDLANNTITTGATSRKVDDIKTSIEGLMAFMQTFEALNKLASVGEMLIKRLLPLALAASTLYGAVRIFWSRR